jgi:hypothetical protein
MQQNSLNAHGVKWGIIIGIVYCVFLGLRYSLGERNIMAYTIIAFLGFIVVMILLLVSGFGMRRKLGGTMELKEAFKVMFVAVLVFEFFFALFNFIYLKYVNPDFFVHFRDATEDFLQQAKQPQADIDRAIKSIDVDGPRRSNLFDLLKGYLFWVAISGALAFLFALIVRKKKDPFQMQRDNFLQS